MTPKHHPPEELLIDLAIGALKRGPRAVIQAHIESCASCREMLHGVEQVGGALLEAIAPTPLGPDALALALARIERPTARLDEAPLLALALRGRRWAAPGVWVAPLAREPGGARSYILGVGPGMRVPRHTHQGREMVCVLKGSYRDGMTLHDVGDFALNDESVEHRPAITNDGECICIVAADGALVALDWIGRFFQPFVGI